MKSPGTRHRAHVAHCSRTAGNQGPAFAWCILYFPFTTRPARSGRNAMNDAYPSRRHTDKPQEKRSLLERLTDFISPEPELARRTARNPAGRARAQPDRRRFAVDDRRRVPGLRSLRARHHGAARADGRDQHRAKLPPNSFPSCSKKRTRAIPCTRATATTSSACCSRKTCCATTREEEFDVRGMLRPAVFIPESKRLNVLLHDFRVNRNHIAIVVDEYGGVAGLITIEDVLEQIVGDIEDEYDFDEESGNIIASPDGTLPRARADRNRAVQRGIRHRFLRRRSRYDRRARHASLRARAASRREGAHRRSRFSKSCAATPARSTCCSCGATRSPGSANATHSTCRPDGRRAAGCASRHASPTCACRRLRAPLPTSLPDRRPRNNGRLVSFPLP